MDQNQPASPFHLSHLITPTLESTIRALSDRPGQTEAQRKARAHDALIQIMSFQPRDVVDMTLAGQTVVFNEMLADSARDILRAPQVTAKARGMSALLGLGRLTQGHLDRLEKRGNKPFKTETDAPEAAAGEPVAAQPRASEPSVAAAPPPAVEPVQSIASAPMPPAPESAEPAEPAYQRPAPSECWLDEPYEQWLLETPASVAAAFEPAEPTKVTPKRGHGRAIPPRSDFPSMRPGSDRAQMETAATGD